MVSKINKNNKKKKYYNNQINKGSTNIENYEKNQK